MKTYAIVRFYASRTRIRLRRFVSLSDAQKHCRDKESSSRTCTTAAGKRLTKRLGEWFDGYTEEK